MEDSMEITSPGIYWPSTELSFEERFANFREDFHYNLSIMFTGMACGLILTCSFPLDRYKIVKLAKIGLNIALIRSLFIQVFESQDLIPSATTAIVGIYYGIGSGIILSKIPQNRPNFNR